MFHGRKEILRSKKQSRPFNENFGHKILLFIMIIIIIVIIIIIIKDYRNNVVEVARLVTQL